MAAKLLPKSVDEFANEKYWKSFFAERGDNSFEWYSDYDDMKTSLHRYIKPADKMLQIGCGNSLLADCLYDSGYRLITSIDVVDEVIKTQRKRNRKKRPELVFQHADATNLSCYESSSFNVAIDKGTLDALLPDESEKHVSIVRKMFDEISRCLTIGGRYLIISLAQDVILRQWMLYFSKSSFLLRVHQIPNKSRSKYQPFILIATKLKPGVTLPNVYEFVSTSLCTHKFANFDELVETAQSAQQYSFFCHRASANFLDEDLHIKLYSSENPSGNPRYEVYIVQKKENPKTGLPYAVFVVPQGRETHWHFSTEKGRQEVCNAAGCRRLAIIFLCRSQNFESLNQVKNELNGVALDFAPRYMPEGTDVLYLSLGDDYLGNRSVRQTFQSSINGDFVVEDVFSGDTNETLRRLVFLSNQNVVQSEIQLIKETTMDGVDKFRLDWNNLSCLHHRAIVASLAMCGDNFIEDELKICLIGVGGGCLATFLRKHFRNASIYAIDLDPVVIEAAKSWFEFVADEKLTCIVDDGVEYLKKCSTNSQRFDVIIFDVGGSYYVDGLLCPPPTFLTDECLANAKSCLSSNGALAINLVCRDDEKSSEIKSRVSDLFETVMSHGIADMVNHLLICLPYKPDDLSIYNQVVQLRLSRLYEYLAQICKSVQQQQREQGDENSVNDQRPKEDNVDEKANHGNKNLEDMFQKLVNL